MRSFLLSLSAAVLLTGCACGTKKAEDPQAASPAAEEGSKGDIPRLLKPNGGMSGAKAAGFGAASDFLK